VPRSRTVSPDLMFLAFASLFIVLLHTPLHCPATPRKGE
jgi:hypothetical protein